MFNERKIVLNNVWNYLKNVYCSITLYQKCMTQPTVINLHSNEYSQ